MILSTAIRSWFERPIRWVKAAVSLQGSLIVLLVVLFLAFVAVMVSETVEKCVGELLGLGSPEKNEKNEILTFLGIGMGGILLALQAVIANRRAKAMEDTAKAQAKATEEQAKANENTEQGQRQERLKNAIEHLGHKSDSVRLGGAYELFHLAKDTKELRQTIMDILCAHIRRTTGETEYQEKRKLKPSEEVQSLLTLMFVEEHKVFKGCRINLQGSWLNGANLQRARLQGANLVEACLQGADIEKAKLQGANLMKAYLQGAELREAHLHGARFGKAHLQGAFLECARLHGADLEEAEMQIAYLFRTQFQGASLVRTRLQGTTLTSAHLQGANLWDACLQGANLNQARLQGINNEDSDTSFAERIRGWIGRESMSPVAIFGGGLSGEDIDSLVEELPNENLKGLLRERLNTHIGKPENKQLSQDREAITKPYTKEEAEQWIAEYEEAMSEIPKIANDQ